MTRSRFLIASLFVSLLALVGPLPALAHRYFWAHMVQHLLLTLVAAPLFVLGAPAMTLLRSTRGGLRRGLVALFRSRAFHVMTHPLVAWIGFALVMWVTHFTPLYQRALENEPVHVFEHALFMGAGVLFWTPVIGADPFTKRRMAWPVRLGYLVAALPLQSFLGLALYSATRPLYAGYPDLADQRLGATIMWLGGDFVFVLAIALTVGAWMRADRAEAARTDAAAPLGDSGRASSTR
jgi:putative copper resistance protein D